ncbi:PREDICTED: indole-3-acetic acid-induced protein ARG7 [Ipomoea nil]|uniref:indole-3-acetic acid-induced protein ARG7 n=1 Tax=Ipomoea nil TaxID=35883 RepID=UPI000901330E|nr:PREDICTED: indole-3-acetic acid-induced protein ARG7 [Ipomoea nil]
MKTWKKCKSLGWFVGKRRSKLGCDDEDGRKKLRRVAPEGCLSVYVGEEGRRFVIKTEYVNHPLFKMLLEEAESEYGYDAGGPLKLPCDVDLFVKVLVEVEMDSDDDDIYVRRGCAFARSPAAAYHHLSPSPF